MSFVSPLSVPKKPAISSSSSVPAPSVSSASSAPKSRTFEVNAARAQTLTDPGKVTPKAQAWNSKFTITVHPSPNPWIEVVAVIDVAADDKIFAAWNTQIQAAWNDKFAITDRSTGVVYPVRAQIVRPALGRPAHYAVQVVHDQKALLGRGLFGTEHMTKWGALDTGGVAHEFGHMIGNKDEYGTVDGVDYSKPENAVESIMHNQDEPVRERHFALIADQAKTVLGHNVEVTKIVKHIAPSVSILNLAPRQSVASSSPSSSAPKQSDATPVKVVPKQTQVGSASASASASSAPKKPIAQPTPASKPSHVGSAPNKVAPSPSPASALLGGHALRVQMITDYVIANVDRISPAIEDFLTKNDWNKDEVLSKKAAAMLGLI